MKKARFIALLCAVVMLLGMTSAASAKTMLRVESNTSSRAMEWNNPVLLENGKTIALFYYSGSDFYDEYGNYVQDIIFDCAGAVKGKCGDSWVTLKETDQGFAITGIETNPTQKKRTATINVSGSSYSAKKPKGKKFKVNVSSYKGKSYGGLSPLYKKTKKIK